MVCGLRSSRRAVPLRACGSGVGVCLGCLRFGDGCVPWRPAAQGLAGDRPCAVTRPPHGLSGAQGPAHPLGFQLLLRRRLALRLDSPSGPPPRPAAVPPGSAGNDSAAPPPLPASPFPCSDSGLLASEITVPGDQGAPTSFQKWELRFSAPIF